MYNSLIPLLIALMMVSCKKDEAPETTTETSSAPNILLIIADDLGKDAIKGYTEGIIKPTTPNIDAIRKAGLTFNNFWVYPTCTPTRAAILTGKYGYRTGVKWAADQLGSSELSLQKYISQQTNNSYASALIGKWHLSGSNNNANPEAFGIDYYEGLIRGTIGDYYNWQLTKDGVVTDQTTYATEYFTTASTKWIREQTKPWFLWLAYNAPHTPFHVPPAGMHLQGNLAAYKNNLDPTPYYIAAIEAMDFQIGKLINALPTAQRENTIIIFIGDNGTPEQVAQSPYSSSTAKATLYQGGINVPMFISGKGVSRIGNDDHLITSTDIFATIAEISGVNVTKINDSQSFKSLLTQSSTIRNYQYSEMNDGTNDIWTIRNNTYKLFVNANGNKEMYHLINDPYEKTNLLKGSLTSDENNAKVALETELSNIRK